MEEFGKIIDGKAIAQEINDSTKAAVARIVASGAARPGLAVVLIGEDPASKVYVGMKVKKSAELGIRSERHLLDKSCAMDAVLALIDKLNRDDLVDGILVQAPPPPQIDIDRITDAIDPSKDVDCFHPLNLGKMLVGHFDGFLPCTPYGVLKIIERCVGDLNGRHVVILGRSNIVGKPLMAMLVQKAKGANATVTVCHSQTKDIPSYTRQADVLVSAIGKAEFVTADMVKEGAVVIDVGINRVDSPAYPNGYRLVGDVAFDQVKGKASHITPVPGGVGPMTIAMLMRNALRACQLRHGGI